MGLSRMFGLWYFVALFIRSLLFLRSEKEIAPVVYRITNSGEWPSHFRWALMSRSRTLIVLCLCEEDHDLWAQLVRQVLCAAWIRGISIQAIGYIAHPQDGSALDMSMYIKMNLHSRFAPFYDKKLIKEYLSSSRRAYFNQGVPADVDYFQTF